MFTRPPSSPSANSAHSGATGSPELKGSSSPRRQRRSPSALQQIQHASPAAARAGSPSRFAARVPFPRPPAAAVAAAASALLLAPQVPLAPNARDDDSPPPYSSLGYPEATGVTGLGPTWPGLLPTGTVSPVHVAAAAMSPPAAAVPPLFTLAPLPRRPAPLQRANPPRPVPPAAVRPAPGPPASSRNHPLSSNALRMTAVTTTALPREAWPASPPGALSYPFTFRWPPDGTVPQASAQSLYAQPSQWRLAAPTQVVFQPVQRLAPLLHPQQPHPPAPGFEQAAEGPPLAAQDARWLQQTAYRLEQADFSALNRRAIARHLGDEARALLMWHLDALRESGYTADELMFMIMQPRAESWLPTLARVAHLLHRHDLTAHNVAALLRGPRPVDALRTFEPGPSRR